MEEIQPIFSFIGVVNIIIQIAIIVTCIILISKKANAGTFIMLIGSFLSILGLLFSYFIPMLVENFELFSVANYFLYSNVFSTIARSLFFIGFAVFTYKIIQEKT